MNDRVRLLGVRCEENCPVLSTPIKQLAQLFPELNMVVVGLIHDDKPVHFSGEDVMEAGDDVYFVVETDRSAGRAEVTVKATFGRHGVVGDGMPGRQSGVSGETCRLRARLAGVRALIVLQRR